MRNQHGEQIDYGNETVTDEERQPSSSDQDESDDSSMSGDEREETDSQSEDRSNEQENSIVEEESESGDSSEDENHDDEDRQQNQGDENESEESNQNQQDYSKDDPSSHNDIEVLTLQNKGALKQIQNQTGKGQVHNSIVKRQEEDAKQEVHQQQRDRRYQSFIKLRSDMFKVTSSTSIRSDLKMDKEPLSSKNRDEQYKIRDYKVFFGDLEQMALNETKKTHNKVRTQRYTVLTWAPLSLAFQFKRLANVYFLIITVLTFMKFSPKDPISMVGTFSLVLFFTMLKEAYEDYQRYKQDKEVNNKLAYVLNPLTMQFETKKWQDIVPGNIVKFEKDQEAPADIVIIHSSNKSGVVYVDTMNLDGETNLKEKNSLFEDIDEEKLMYLNGEIICDYPNENLEKWDARLLFNNDQIKTPNTSIKNLLLRGCVVRNTHYGIGIVTYTGMNTKIMKNLKKPPHKVSNIMKLMNKMLYSVFAFQLCLIILFAGLNVKWVEEDGDVHEYLNIDTSMSKAGQFFIQLLVYWVAYSHMIPISLYVIIELLKLGTAIYVNKDTLMFDKETESYARCRNSDLIEELGQVEMIFSDKTGTLTQNKMIFKKCQINGNKYGEPKPEEKDYEDGMVVSGIKETRNMIRKESETGSQSNPNYAFPYVTEFFLNLALCNTVMCEKDEETGEVQYKASSPDELALVNGAKLTGIKLYSRQHNRVTVLNLLTKQTLTYKIIAEFPFDSVRKRMSVIVKDPNGKYHILCKGADAVMLERINYEKNGIDGLRDLIDKDLYNYSCEGLRTLMMTKRSISQEEYNQFKKIYNYLQQYNSSNREEKLFQLYDAMEQKLRYLGCTAIEDKLQEGVPLTIAKLLDADIRFFMLTGDKLETAIEIAKSCQVIQDDMAVIILGRPEKEKVYRKLQRIISILNIDINDEIYSLNEVQQERQVITVEGSTLGVILSDYELQTLFFHVAIRSKSVVCCRMSPKQKADVVQMFKCRGKWITLAIGDGANDVSMIMEAHIGVGIKGKEGTQAVRSADFSISQFQYLLRLILIHGRYGYLRVSQMICYYFYKNIILVFTELYFAFNNGFSGQIFFLDWFSVLYNAFFTSWHCLFSQLLEKDVNENYSYKYPLIYKAGQLGKYFNFKIFWQWIIMAIWHGLVCFYGPMIAGEDSSTQDEGKRGSHWFHSTISFTIIIHLVFYKLLLETRHFNSITFCFGILSMLCYYAVLFITQIPEISFTFQPQILGLVPQMLNYPEFWLLLIVLPFVCLIPDFIIKFVLQVFFPSPVDKVIMEQKYEASFSFKKYLETLEKEEEFKRRKTLILVEKRKQLIKERQKTLSDTYVKQESHVNLTHLEAQLSRVRKEKKSGELYVTKDSRKLFNQVSIHDDMKELNSKTIDEVDEENLTDSDEDNSGSSGSCEDSNSYNQDEDTVTNQEASSSQDRSQVLDQSSRSLIDQSFRSNRALIESNQVLSIEKIRENRKDQKSKESMDKKLKSKQSLKGQVSLKSRKSNKRESMKHQNNSMFSVSDSSRAELFEKNGGNSHFLEYFEDLNKEIIERQNTNKAAVVPVAILEGQKLKVNPSSQSMSATDHQTGTLTDEQMQIMKAKKKVQQRKNRKVQNIGQYDVRDGTQQLDVEVENVDKTRKASESKQKSQQQNNSTNQLQSMSNSEEDGPNNQGFNGDIDPIHEAKRPNTTNKVDKESFKKILGNRTKNLFMISTNYEIPKNQVTKPHQIVDQIVVNSNIANERPLTVAKPQLSYLFGHPLESSRINTKDQRSSGDSKISIKKKKRKKYVEKYNIANLNTNNNSNNS